LDVAAGQSFVGLFVVFDVIGAESLAGVVNVNVVIGDEEVALVTLRTLGRKLGHAAFGSGRADLLGSSASHTAKNQDERKQCCRRKKLKRGKFPSMGVTIHAEDVVNRTSPIA